VTFSDLEIIASQCLRKHGYVRDCLLSIWTPGAGKVQHGHSRELAGAMLFEADVFFDRALALYLLRGRLRELQHSTWAGVAVYYANYFLALSFTRLHMTSVTQVSLGDLYEVGPTNNQALYFTIGQRGQRQRHTEVWRTYYEVVTQMAWPDRGTALDLAPTLASLRFREQLYRERINYRPGEGFEEISLTRPRYLESLKASLTDDGSAPTALTDAAYTDRMAARRLSHVATLLRRLSEARRDADVEASVWHRRRDIIAKYATDHVDRKFGSSLVGEVA
jgi:hypothetical protein